MIYDTYDVKYYIGADGKIHVKFPKMYLDDFKKMFKRAKFDYKSKEWIVAKSNLKKIKIFVDEIKNKADSPIDVTKEVGDFYDELKNGKSGIVWSDKSLWKEGNKYFVITSSYENLIKDLEILKRIKKDQSLPKIARKPIPMEVMDSIDDTMTKEEAIWFLNRYLYCHDKPSFDCEDNQYILSDLIYKFFHEDDPKKIEEILRKIEKSPESTIHAVL